jgi:hypothetical protein
MPTLFREVPTFGSTDSVPLESEKYVKLESEKYTKDFVSKLFAQLANDVYAAGQIFEDHEQYHDGGSGCLSGNGHHARQKLAAYAQKLFVEHLRPEYKEWFFVGIGGDYYFRDSYSGKIPYELNTKPVFNGISGE